VHVVRVEAVPQKLFQSYSTALAGGMGGAGPEDLSPLSFGHLALMMAVHPGEDAEVRSHRWSLLLPHPCGGHRDSPKGPCPWG